MEEILWQAKIPYYDPYNPLIDNFRDSIPIRSLIDSIENETSKPMKRKNSDKI